jgi:ribosomal protein S18 acetylase RimI-like enzyme
MLRTTGPKVFHREVEGSTVTTEPTVREATPEDAESVYELTRRSWVDVFAAFLHSGAVDWDDAPGPEFREWFEETCESDRRCQLVAELGSTAVGCAEVGWDSEVRSFVGENEAELAAIHVDPDHWGEGVGSALLEAVREGVPGEREGIALKVLRENDRARAFYERRGFAQDGTTTTTIEGREYTEAVYRSSE